MQMSITTLALAAFALTSALAQPARHAHKHTYRRNLKDVLDKRQDWNNPALYADVDWATVNYGGGSSPPATQAPAPSPAPAPAAAAPAASSSPSPSQSPVAVQEKVAVSSTSGSNKRGLAYNSSSPDLDVFNGFSEISWGYNWGYHIDGLPSRFQYVPTLFSNAEDHTQLWPQFASAFESGNMMCFNEPDIPSQANMAVGEAVAAWNQYMAPYASANVKIGSPSVSNSNIAGQGLSWLSSFLQQCSGCAISFVPVHWYGCNAPCDVQADITAFKTQITQAMQVAGSLPVWVTEFGTNSGDPTTFMSEVLPWLDSQSQIARYSYFMAVDGILTNGNSLSALGQQYGSS